MKERADHAMLMFRCLIEPGARNGRECNKSRMVRLERHDLGRRLLAYRKLCEIKSAIRWTDGQAMQVA